MGFHLPKSKWMLRREAASWLARLQSRRDPEVERGFRRWYADPRHAEAFDRVRRSYEQAGLLRQSPHVAPPGLPRHSIHEPHWTLRPALAAAIAAAILLPAGAVVFRGDGVRFGGTDAVMLMTRVGEIRQVELADGSKVTLDTASKLDLEIGRSRRSAHLRYGRARFQVMQASTPFIIETDTATVTTDHGVIDVAQAGLEGRVQVLAGAADVRDADPARASRFVLDSGEGATVNSSGAERAAVTIDPDWTRGMLQFDATPLTEAVALANRYSHRRIILTGDVNALRVTGAFRAGDTIGLAKALAAAFALSLREAPDGNLVLSRELSSEHQNKTGG